ncbi:MAG: DUF4445 domain-containing protein [Methanoregulaceae archaeon]|nr:MAG: DUF4445 domain-containing protein [Methanoregulaceae archaeon]
MKPLQSLAQIHVMPLNRTASVPIGSSLLDALRQAEIPIEMICGGKGLCRKCRVILSQGSCRTVIQPGGSPPSPEEEEQGIRFACQVVVTGDCEFQIPLESRREAPQILLASFSRAAEICPSVARYPVERISPDGLPFAGGSIRLVGYSGIRPQMSEAIYDAILRTDTRLVATVSFHGPNPEIISLTGEGEIRPLYGVAIDLGTTTVAGCLAKLETGEILTTGSALNRQIPYGEELVTRIGYARSPEQRNVLQRAAAGSINAVIREMASSAGISSSDIADVTVAGNTVMIHLLANIDPRYLELADAAVSREPSIGAVDEIDLEAGENTRYYCLSNVSRYLGGDVVGGILAAGMHRSPELSLFIDLGTNGEIVLGSRDWLSSVSCASGPAFEGSGIRSGMRAMRGAIDHVRIDPETKDAECTVIGNVLPRGICGSGIIDAAAEMVTAGVLDFAGKLVDRCKNVRPGSEGLEYVLVPAGKTGIQRDIVITQRDIDYLLDSKAAACGAIAVLLKKYRLTVSDIRHVYLAGAFGAYASMENAVRFGIIPRFPNTEFHPLGNGSVAGAYLALVNRRSRDEAQEIAQKMVYIDLLVDIDFIEEYSAALYIPGRPELFPP